MNMHMYVHPCTCCQCQHIVQLVFDVSVNIHKLTNHKLKVYQYPSQMLVSSVHCHINKEKLITSKCIQIQNRSKKNEHLSFDRPSDKAFVIADKKGNNSELSNTTVSINTEWFKNLLEYNYRHCSVHGSFARYLYFTCF